MWSESVVDKNKRKPPAGESPLDICERDLINRPDQYKLAVLMKLPRFRLLPSATLLVALTLLGSKLHNTHSFAPPTSPIKQNNLQLHSVSKWNEEYRSEEEDDDLVTKEQFLRDMLNPESARTKKKGKKEYKPHDNRDALPFIVKVKTPHPYQDPEDMLEEAKYNSEMARRGKKNKMSGKKISNLVGMDERYSKDAISASISVRRKDGTLYKVLGQFDLDKNTNCGDSIMVGEREFEVVTARSQFK